MSATRLRRRAASIGRCWICQMPNIEQGQRGRRQAHQHCRKLHDAGYRVALVRTLKAEDACRS